VARKMNLDAFYQ